ncbi:MAG: hypothetical protein FJX75_01320 [Armatimonadetes bacterium]|nr:hypothetical protein [Armatimonadota bacterium]
MRDRTAVARLDAHVIATELAALLGFSLAITVTAGLIKTPMALPGHSAVFWMPVLLLACCRRPGMTAGAALAGGGLGAALGAIRPNELAALMISASIVEAFGLALTSRWRTVLLLVAGIAGNLGKLALKGFTLGLAGLPLNHTGLPFMPTLAIYAASGLVAGFIAIGILAGWARLRKRRT